VIGTGLLAVPVLAGSAALKIYAISPLHMLYLFRLSLRIGFGGFV